MSAFVDKQPVFEHLGDVVLRATPEGKKTPRPPRDEALSVFHGIATKGDVADDARKSVLGFMRALGRDERGNKLRMDPEFEKTVQAADDALRLGKDFVDEQGRGSGKSVIGRHVHAYMIGQDPEISILHYSNRDDESQKRNMEVQAIMQTEDYKTVFGRRAHLRLSGRNKSTTSRTVTIGKTNAVQANIEASGIESARAGPHVDRLWLDDVCDEKTSIIMPAKKVHIKTTFFTTIQPMLIDPRSLRAGGRTLYGHAYWAGTPYAQDDLWAWIVNAAKQAVLDAINRNDPRSSPYVYRRMAFGGPPDFVSPVPSLMTSETLKELFEQPGNERAYRMAYMLIPVGADEQPFQMIRYWLHEAYNLDEKDVAKIGYRPMVLPRKQYDPETRTWPCIVCVDPGFKDNKGSSYTGVVVGLKGDDGTIFLIYGSVFKMRWDKGRERVVEIARRHCVTRVGVEDVAQQAAAVSYFRDMGLPGVFELTTRGRGKVTRAMDVSGEVNSGRVVLPGIMLPAGRGISAARGYGDIGILVGDLLGYPICRYPDYIDAFVYLVQELAGRGTPARPPIPETMLTTEQSRLQLFKDKVLGQEVKEDEDTSADIFMDEEVEEWAGMLS